MSISLYVNYTSIIKYNLLENKLRQDSSKIWVCAIRRTASLEMRWGRQWEKEMKAYDGGQLEDSHFGHVTFDMPTRKSPGDVNRHWILESRVWGRG